MAKSKPKESNTKLAARQESDADIMCVSRISLRSPSLSLRFLSGFNTRLTYCCHPVSRRKKQVRRSALTYFR